MRLRPGKYSVDDCGRNSVDGYGRGGRSGIKDGDANGFSAFLTGVCSELEIDLSLGNGHTYSY